MYSTQGSSRCGLLGEWVWLVLLHSLQESVGVAWGVVPGEARGQGSDQWRNRHVPHYLLGIAAVDDSDVLCQNGAGLAADLLYLWSKSDVLSSLSSSPHLLQSSRGDKQSAGLWVVRQHL